MKREEGRIQKAVRIALGWASGLFVLLGPLPYPIPWWGRLVVAFILISFAHSTVGASILSNVAKSGPAIVGLVRGVGVGNRRASQTDTRLIPDSRRRRKSDPGES